MKRLDRWLGRLNPHARMGLGPILVLGSLIFMFAFPRDVVPSVIRYPMWIIPLGIGVWALTQDSFEREHRSLTPQRRMDGTYETTPRDQ